jgi:hypothetical protein
MESRPSRRKNRLGGYWKMNPTDLQEARRLVTYLESSNPEWIIHFSAVTRIFSALSWRYPGVGWITSHTWRGLEETISRIESTNTRLSLPLEVKEASQA